MIKKLVWIVIGVAVLAVTGFLGVKYLPAIINGGAGVKTAVVSTINVTQKIKASGSLEARSAASLIWKINGTVQSIPFKVGDHVKKDRVLLSLESTSAPANIISAQADLVTARLALDHVKKSSLELAQAQDALAKALKAVDDAQEDVTKLDFRRASDDLLTKTQDQIDLAKKAVSRAEDYYKLVKHRPEGDSIRAQAELTLIEARTYRDERIRTLNWYTGRPDDIDAAKYRAALALAQAQQADAQREIDRLKDGPTADDISAAQARVDAAQATLNLLYIIAPFDGEVLAIEQNPGDVVTAGELAVSIADRSSLHIDAQVDESDIANVVIGNPVQITMDTMPGADIKGTVTYINPVGQTITGLIKYLVRVELEPLDKAMLLGASADAFIQVSEAQEALAVPFLALQSDGTGEYLTVIAPDGNTIRVDVQSGESVGELVVVKGDLKTGERIQYK